MAGPNDEERLLSVFDWLDQRGRELERLYVDQERERLRTRRPELADIELEKALVQQLRLRLHAFARTDVLTKAYPPDEDVIICEGDSWFDHPFLQDIPTQLYSVFRFCVLHSNRPGKLLSETVGVPDFLSPFRDFRKPQIKALLLSGGGNDLINWKKSDADSHSPIFKPASSSVPDDFIDCGEVESALKAMIAYFEQIIALLNSVGAEKLPVLLHCYDHIIPAYYGHTPFKGSWVRPQLLAVGADPSLHVAITRRLQDKWMSAYSDFCNHRGWYYIKAENVVGNRWYDEIHPHSRPFFEITRLFKQVLLALNIQPTKHPRQMPSM